MIRPSIRSIAAVIFSLILAVAAGADFYKVLGVSKSASESEIKKAYKKLSRTYHPDKTDGNHDKFVEVARAYEVLGDSEKRAIYDREGEEGLNAREGGRQSNPFAMFQNFFGHNQQESVRRGPSSISEFEVSLADMYTGGHVEFMVKKRILCDHCRGTGAASDGDIKQCGGCGGSGVKMRRQEVFPGMFAQTQQTCDECGGRGKVIKRTCPHCGGQKVLDHTQYYTLDVLPGMPEGREVVFEGAADESPDWEAGDVILRVRSGKQKGGFRRKETSLYWKETIGVDEALLGFKRNITHLDGHTVEIRRAGVTQPGFVQTIKGEGMPIFLDTGEFGDLFVEYDVVLPTNLSPSLRKKLTEAFREIKSKDEL